MRGGPTAWREAQLAAAAALATAAAAKAADQWISLEPSAAA